MSERKRGKLALKNTVLTIGITIIDMILYVFL